MHCSLLQKSETNYGLFEGFCKMKSEKSSKDKYTNSKAKTKASIPEKEYNISQIFE